jgi:PAS domain S-box-containing protein
LDPLLAITAEGKITDVNVATERATGHSRHELIGTDFSGYFTEPGSAIAAYSEAFENGSVQNSPLEIRHANGHVTPVLYNASVYCDESGHVIGVFAAARDITRLKRAEVALRESEARNRLLVEESPFGIGIVKHGMCADANPALVKVLGFTHPNEVIGKRMDEFVSTEEREWVAQLEKQVLEAEDLQVPIEIRGRKSNGKVFDLSIWPKRIAHMGEPAVLFVADDTTEAKCLKAQLLQAQKMEAVGTLAGGIAHEFNNLLQVISGYAEMLILDRSEGETGYEDVQKIILSAQRGAELVRKLQVFSSKSEIRQGPLNLNRHVEQVKDLLMPTIPKMIEIEVNLANDLDLVNADSGQMEQVLMNLALNAKDAMLEGGKLTIETRNLTLDADYCRLRPEMKPGDYVELTVSDTGIGMDEETLDHIFEPFYTTKGLAYRSGLGLAVVHGIVHQHKGYITCESKPGEGSTFTIYFPAIATNLQSESDLKEAKPAGGTETILLVDDEECIRELASRFLSQSGYRVLTADNGQEALDLYRTEQESVSLVILDLIMPRMSGSQCLEWLLKIDSKARILIASGYSETEKRGELIRAGVKGFVSKPFRMVEMLKAVRDVLDAD